MSCCKDKNQGCSGSRPVATDYLVCTCMGVMYSEIKSAIKNGSKTFDSLSQDLGVGTGCSSCVAEVETILKEEVLPGCCKS